jgi:hypothetical protein
MSSLMSDREAIGSMQALPLTGWCTRTPGKIWSWERSDKLKRSGQYASIPILSFFIRIPISEGFWGIDKNPLKTTHLIIQPTNT